MLRKIAIVLMLIVGAPTHGEEWVVINLHPAGAGSSRAYGVDGYQQVGYATVGGDRHAALWTGSSARWIDLHPEGATRSDIEGVQGGQQVGVVVTGTSTTHASLWTGTAASWVSLSPGGTESGAYGVYDGWQVGFAELSGVNRASLWSGAATPRIDLHPDGSSSSIAYGVYGLQQVGSANFGEGHRAGLWTSSAASWIPLNPGGATISEATAVDGGEAVGYAIFSNDSRASLWRGTAASWVDLNPAQATQSWAYGVHDGEQAGYAIVNSRHRASLWRGTPASWVDLSAYLPPTFGDSEAHGIWHDGIHTFVVGFGRNTMTGRDEALMWVSPGYLDCQSNGIPDDSEIAAGSTSDCDSNQVPDTCELAGEDCNSNGTHDSCDILGGESADCDSNGTPDECQADADGDGAIDACDLCPADPLKIEPGSCGCGAPDGDSDGDTVPDCNDACAGHDDRLDCDHDAVPDGCETDCNSNATPDDCEARPDCNSNGVLDECEIAAGSPDCNTNGTPDDCETASPPTPCQILLPVSRKPHGGTPRDIKLTLTGSACGDATSESRQGGVTELRIGFTLPPGGPGPCPVTISEMRCPGCPAWSPYSGASTSSATVEGNDVVLAFTPGLENARTYKFDISPSVSTLAGQSLVVRVLKGDVTDDGRVDGIDRSVVVGVWTGSGFSPKTDINGDGATNAVDRSIVVGAWTGNENCAP